MHFCQKQVNFTTIDKIKEHRKSKNHTSKLQKIIDTPQTNPSYLVLNRNDVVLSLFDLFVSTNIPIFKIRHKKWKGFLNYHFNIAISETDLRRKLNKLTEEKINKIKNILNIKLLFVIMDESTLDNMQFLNILIGDLENQILLNWLTHKFYLNHPIQI